MIEWIYFSLGLILGFAVGVYSAVTDSNEVRLDPDSNCNQGEI